MSPGGDAGNRLPAWTTDVLPDAVAPEIHIRTRIGIAEMKNAIEATGALTNL
ncbi:hypothetical protein [Nocardia sp. alder85J]|uniref:hypothetical protein n=1 Tax=Nocardia sp. alder85J TaxID=2862949 RepID=UPI001CD3FFDC|nr:hypothetical protein [Nocardia sp. alder85J]MCX4092414.1 hypothetical protein [Nocardia sp. alder85J]